MELGHFDKYFVKNIRKICPGKHFGVFSPVYSLNCILNGKFNPKMKTIRAFFSKIRALSSIFKKSRGGFPLLSSCTPVNVAEYVSISLNIPKYLWKYLNKLLWLWQGFEYTLSSYIFDTLLMPRVLNVPWFLIWHGYILESRLN